MIKARIPDVHGDDWNYYEELELEDDNDCEAIAKELGGTVL